MEKVTAIKATQGTGSKCGIARDWKKTQNTNKQNRARDAIPFMCECHRLSCGNICGADKMEQDSLYALMSGYLKN